MPWPFDRGNLRAAVLGRVVVAGAGRVREGEDDERQLAGRRARERHRELGRRLEARSPRPRASPRRGRGRCGGRRPSGSAISSRKKRPTLRPSTRRTSSPTSHPNVIGWYAIWPGRHARLGAGERGGTSPPGRRAPRAAAVARSAGRPARWREQPAHRDRVLAARRELGPVARDGRVEVERAALDQAVGAERRHALRHRVDVHERVAPATGACARGRRSRPRGRRRARRPG